ncbi:golgin subfamily A member 7-like protein [Dinothrombium tinctorium]|uniref:Ras modification protein ERF4 n=1 Tax=Dinothrombium tinctorium TaxID=1965070 RepID=A0A3S3SF95_9ACAR|nr:golgin subfamily A member 7-like protein [Dinothrombium tinctorium]
MSVPSTTASAANQSSSNNQSAGYKKIFIQRDYSEGSGVKFLSKFPSELEGLIDRQHFEYLINTLNSIYADAERMSTQTFCESCFSCISAYLLYLCIETYYQKCMRKVAAFIDEQNDTVWKPRGLLLTDPIERGLRVIEITIFDKETSTQRRQLGTSNESEVHK